MRKNILKQMAGVAAVFGLCIGMAFSAFAYEDSDKSIRSISITVSGSIEVETKIGEEELEIHTSGNKYSFDHYEVQNAGFRWCNDDVPVIKIFLTAADGYYFRILKASQIRLNGAEYVSAAREDSAYTLVVEARLPSLETQVGEIGEAKLDGGVCTWSEAVGAGAYELKFMRKGTTLGGVQVLTERRYDGSGFMTKPAGYHFMVRPINAKDAGIKGKWTDSNEVVVNEAQAKQQKEKNASTESAGTWVEENGAWRFLLPEGVFMQNGWRRVGGEWYAFDPLGQMRTGWYLEGDKWYYLDLKTGAMLKNTVTPDGYTIGIDGVMAAPEESGKTSRPGR